MFIRNPFYTKISREEDITTLAFISTSAGLLSLCMGLSFVSMFEVIYHFFNFLLTKFRKTLC
jgi:Amiloride-sensitive sodium channel